MISEFFVRRPQQNGIEKQKLRRFCLGVLFPGRFVSLPLKDLRRDKAPDNTGEVQDEDGRPLGQGKVNWPAVLREARRQRIQWYIVEDETPTVWQAIPQRLKYLEAVKF